MTESKFFSLILAMGVLALAAGTFMHPMHEDPNDAVKAFAEYAADSRWLMSHLIQLAGVVCMVLGLLGLLAKSGCDGAMMMICVALGASTIAVSCVLQAVDGVALKFMADRWAAAGAADKTMAFQAAYAVRMIEVGLAAAASLITGLTVAVSAMALYKTGFIRQFLLCAGLLAGFLFGASGWIIGATGFSGLSMTVNMPAGIFLMLWIVALAVIGWRFAPNNGGLA
jgi:hypothetical protein